MTGGPWDEDDADEPAWFEWDDAPEEDRPGLPGMTRGDWLDPWIAAADAPEVARAAMDAAEAWTRLATRLTYDPAVAGGMERLAQAEAADAMWLAGDAGARDRLALYAQGVRAAVDGRDLLAHWALRRLAVEDDPSAMSVPEMRGFLGRARQDHADPLVEDAVSLFPRPVGDELDLGLRDWLGVSTQLDRHHRLIRAAILHRAWRWLNLSGPEDPVTPAIVAASIGGAAGLPFAPFAGAARRMRIFAVRGSHADRLHAVLRAFEAGAKDGTLMLERMAAWRGRAMDRASTKAMRAVIEATARHPVTSTNAIAGRSGLTPQAVNKAARDLRDAGLVREATGQSRFRLWAAPL